MIQINNINLNIKEITKTTWLSLLFFEMLKQQSTFQQLKQPPAEPFQPIFKGSPHHGQIVK
jgi:hypothetical protein